MDWISLFYALKGLDNIMGEILENHKIHQLVIGVFLSCSDIQAENILRDWISLFYALAGLDNSMGEIKRITKYINKL